MASVAYMQPDPDYRREIGENQSSLKSILVSPAHYKAAKNRRFLPTVNMEIGSAIHCKVLEGDEEFDKRYVLKPDDINLNTKEGKEWKLNNRNKTVLYNNERDKAWDSVHGMTESLRELDWFNPNQEEYRKYNEVSIYWDRDGIPCKARLDRLILTKEEAIILDLKSTDTVDQRSFEKKVTGGMNYIFQAAWYTEAVNMAFKKPARFIFVGVERSDPWSKGIFEVSDEMTKEGQAQVEHACQILKDCQRSKVWPGPKTSYTVMQLPPWFESPVPQRNSDFEDLF